MINKTFIYPSVGLVAAGIGAFELFIIRFFSLAHFESYYYIPISVTILGFALASALITFFQKKIKENPDLFLGISLSLAMVSTTVCFLILKEIEFNPSDLLGSFFLFKKLLTVLIFYLILTFPFFFSSFFIVLTFQIEKKSFGPLYLFKIVGSGIGSILFLILLFFIPVKYLIFIAIISLALAAFLIISKEKKYKLIFLFVTLISLIVPFFKLDISVMPYKDIAKAQEKGAFIVQEKQSKGEVNKLEKESYLGVLQVAENLKDSLPIGISSLYQGKTVDYKGIFLDGNKISDFIGKGQDVIDFTPYKIAYAVKNTPKTLILSSGGGIGIMAGLYYKSKKIHAIEKNSQLIDLLERNRTISEYTGGIFSNFNVENISADIRPFVVSSIGNKKYDLIDLNLYALRENTFREESNYLLTFQALENYTQLLEENGMLMITIPLQNPPRLEYKLAATIKKVLQKKGIHDKANVFFLKTADTFVAFIKNTAFSADESALIKNKTDSLKFDILYPNLLSYDVNLKTEYYHYLDAVFENKKEELEKYPFDISPITDDSPFIFYSLKFSRMFELPNIPSDEMGYITIIVSALLVLLIAVFLSYSPVILTRHDYSKTIHISKVILFFGGQGAAFMLVLMIFIQKINLLLSSTTISVAVVFASAFLFNALGIWVSQKFQKKVTGLAVAFSSLIVILAGYSLFFDPIFYFILKQGFSMRVVLVVLFIALPSFFMGMPFWLGLEWIKHFERNLIPWCWTINRALGVFAAVFAVFLSIQIGLKWTFILSIFFYLVSFGSFIWMDIYYQKVSYLYRRYKV